MTLDYRSNGNCYPDPINQGFITSCETCEETYETDESQAEEYERFCSISCENDQDFLSGVDPMDDNDHIDNQDK